MEARRRMPSRLPTVSIVLAERSGVCSSLGQRQLSGANEVFNSEPFSPLLEGLFKAAQPPWRMCLRSLEHQQQF